MPRKSKEADKAYAKAWRQRPEVQAREKAKYEEKWKSPEFRAKQAERNRKAWEDPERREKWEAKKKEWIKKNKARLRAAQYAWKKRNAERVKSQRLRLSALPENKEKQRLRDKKRRSTPEFRAKRAAAVRDRRKQDKNFQIEAALRSRIQKAIKGTAKKSKRTRELIGCEVEFLMGWIESQFTDGMSWENYGPKGWHVDHKLPCASFDLCDPEQQKACFRYTNLQPLWWIENLRKNDKVIDFPNVA